MIDKDCPFCEVIAREDPDAREVFRNEHVVAFFPTEPATLGHTLVVPKAHIRDIWSLDSTTAAELSEVILRLATAIREAVEPDGLNVIQSNGEAATQTVPHLHVHLVPRWHGDPIGRIWPPETNYSEQQKDDALVRVRDALRDGMRRE
jgi:diadenosine tetraphosphate (Ap4A) HIT family hydrolase